MALPSRFETTCRTRTASARSGGSWLPATPALHPFRVELGIHEGQRLADRGTTIHRPTIERQLVRGDARHIEQVTNRLTRRAASC